MQPEGGWCWGVSYDFNRVVTRDLKEMRRAPPLLGAHGSRPWQESGDGRPQG